MSQQYLVQGFTRSKKGGIIEEAPFQVFSQIEARRAVNRLAIKSAFALAVVDEDGDVYLVHAVGDVPDSVLDMPRYEGC